ncbi:MAG: thioredoxin family protein [Ferruginibacter sp.]
MHFFRNIILSCLCICICFFSAVSQDTTGAIKFTYSKNRTSNNEVLLTIKATLKSGIKLYSVRQSSPDALGSSIQFDSASIKYLEDSIKESNTPATEKDASLNAETSFFKDSVLWQQNVKLKAADSVVLKGTVNYMYKEGDEYKPGEEHFKFFIQPDNATVKETPKATGSQKSLLYIFLAGFAGGLLALVTPCVFSMIPVTVGFFTKRSKTKIEGRKNAILYSASIIFIFTFVGFLITLIWGPTALNNISTNWIFNLFIFGLFLIFGFSFLGAFEITLPSSWSTKADSKAGVGNFIGIFFMALVLVLVSFSCTGPVIGLLLPLIFKGGFWGPLVGFLGFSSALALPFSLFAFFPSWLNSLSKPGGWMNAIKVTLGFLELALALKFLSNADLVKEWRILDREVFLSLWIVIFALMGFYLLGKLKFHHDDELPKNDFGIPYLSVTRLLFAITALSFAVYMIPGLWGAPLKGISAFVPPMGTQDYIAGGGKNIQSNNSTSSADNELPTPVKYYDKMKKYEPEVVTTYGMVTYFDYDEALAIARKLKKPLMLDFTGINCVNCRKMEGQVWSDPEVMKRLKENFVIVSLYIDVQSIDLQEKEQYYSKALGKKIETLGDKNADMQVTKFEANSQPYYFFLDANEKKLADEGYGYDPDVQKFIKMLDNVSEKYKKTLQ